MSACFFLSRSRPVDFRCTIVPRDDRAKELIIAANMDDEHQLSAQLWHRIEKHVFFFFWIDGVVRLSTTGYTVLTLVQHMSHDDLIWFGCHPSGSANTAPLNHIASALPQDAPFLIQPLTFDARPLCANSIIFCIYHPRMAGTDQHLTRGARVHGRTSANDYFSMMRHIPNHYIVWRSHHCTLQASKPQAFRRQDSSESCMW